MSKRRIYISEFICRLFVMVQLFGLILFYLLAAFKLMTKQYDPRFCQDFMVFGRISLFWFIHLIIFGILLACFCFIFSKISAKAVMQWEIIFIFGFVLFMVVGELYFRLNPQLLPLNVLSSLKYTEDDVIIKNKLQNTILDKYTEDRELGFIYKPNLSFDLKVQEFSYTVRTDNNSFHNYHDESLYENADIVTIGDSFTEGAGVPAEFSYPRQLAAILHVRVLNLGHGAYDCYQFPIVLKRFGLKSHPKIVLMTLWDWNDLQLRYPYWREYCKANGYVPFKDYSRFIQSKENGTDKLPFYMFAYFKYLEKQSKMLIAKYMALWNYGDYRGICVNGKWYRFPMTDAIAYRGEFLEKCLNYAEEFTGEIKALSQKHKFRFIVIYLPSKQFVYNYFLNLPPSQSSKDEMKNTVINRLKNMGIEVIDITPIFVQSVKAGVMPFYPLDDHLNKEGYSVLSTFIADYLRNAPELKNPSGN